ncbi:MAG: tRNA pseudouridine(38-40) synthase TruA [Fusobacteriaceae bacterium]
MRNIKLIYMYDGTDFLGFQRQPKSRTVQGVLEDMLFKITKEKINLISSGRTDRGVHAHMQVSNFSTKSSIPPEKLLKALNNMAPQDISIQNCEDVDCDFNSRFSAKERVYRYYITTLHSPFNNRFSTYIDENIEINKFSNILSSLIGQHNFTNFRLADCSSKNQIRNINSIICQSIDSHNFFVEIAGNGFLKSQIRIIIGTAIEIYKGRKSQDYFKILLTDFSRFYPKIVSPPNGLTLFKIKY